MEAHSGIVIGHPRESLDGHDIGPRLADGRPSSAIWKPTHTDWASTIPARGQSLALRGHPAERYGQPLTRSGPPRMPDGRPRTWDGLPRTCRGPPRNTDGQPHLYVGRPRALPGNPRTAMWMPRHKGGRSRNSRGHPRHASSCLVWAWGWTAKTHALGNHNVWPRHLVGLPRNCGHLQLWASTRTSRCLVGVQVIGPGQTWGICGRPHAFSGHPTSGHPMRSGLARCRRGHEPARSLRCGRVDAMCCVRAWTCVSTQAILRGRTRKDGKI